MQSYIEDHPRREEWFQRDLGGRAEIFHIWIDMDCPNTKTILDLGMGRGELVRLLRNDGKRAYGVDLRMACSEGLIVADAGFLPFRDNSFDVVTESMLLVDLENFQNAPKGIYKRVYRKKISKNSSTD